MEVDDDASATGGEDEDEDDEEPEQDEQESDKLTKAEADVVGLANIILFPDKYEFYMATRSSTPEGGGGGGARAG